MVDALLAISLDHINHGIVLSRLLPLAGVGLDGEYGVPYVTADGATTEHE
ncbi:hypothetical protein MY11210_008497 [Beauveria gryllotalpidicola]